MQTDGTRVLLSSDRRFSLRNQTYGEQASGLLVASSGVPPHQRRPADNVTLHCGIQDLAP